MEPIQTEKKNDERERWEIITLPWDKAMKQLDTGDGEEKKEESSLTGGITI